MKPIAVMLFVILGCVSCSSFQQLHYRHVRKVPATPMVFVAAPVQASSNTSRNTSVDSVSRQEEPIPAASLVSVPADTTSVAIHDSVPLFAQAFAKEIGKAKSWRGAAVNFQRQQRRDWSLAIAALFIVTGLLLLLYVIFTLSAGGPMLLGRILLSIAITFAAAHLLVRGFSMFKNRFRNKKTYKES